MAKAKGTGARGALGRFNFAHLIGGSPKPAAEDAPEEKEEDEPEGNEEDSPTGEGEDEPDVAEGDEPEPEGEGEDTPEGEGEEEETEAAAAFAGVIAAAEARGAAKERQRCASIFGSKHAAGRIGMAAELAFNTSLDAKAAIGVLSQSPAEKKGGALAAAMSKQKQPQVGSDAPASGKGADAAVQTALGHFAALTGRKLKTNGGKAA